MDARNDTRGPNPPKCCDYPLSPQASMGDTLLEKLGESYPSHCQPCLGTSRHPHRTLRTKRMLKPRPRP